MTCVELFCVIKCQRNDCKILNLINERLQCMFLQEEATFKVVEIERSVEKYRKLKMI